MSQLLIGVGLLLISIVLRALALPIVTSVLRGWVWLYTWGLPCDLRDRRRRETASDLQDHVRTLRDEERFSPELVAVHVIWAWCRNVPSDLADAVGGLVSEWGRRNEGGLFHFPTWRSGQDAAAFLVITICGGMLLGALPRGVGLPPWPVLVSAAVGVTVGTGPALALALALLGRAEPDEPACKYYPNLAGRKRPVPDEARGLWKRHALIGLASVLAMSYLVVGMPQFLTMPAWQSAPLSGVGATGFCLRLWLELLEWRAEQRAGVPSQA